MAAKTQAILRIKNLEKMNRSKNHLLYQLYLEQDDAEDLYFDTKHISLGHIVAYVKEEKLPEEIDTWDQKDFARAAAYKELDNFGADDFAKLYRVISKIDDYHANK